MNGAVAIAFDEGQIEIDPQEMLEGLKSLYDRMQALSANVADYRDDGVDIRRCGVGSDTYMWAKYVEGREAPVCLALGFLEAGSIDPSYVVEANYKEGEIYAMGTIDNAFFDLDRALEQVVKYEKKSKAEKKAHADHAARRATCRETVHSCNL